MFSKSTVQPSCNITVNGEKINQIEQFSYLGSLVTHDGRCDKEIRRRIGIAESVFRSMEKVLTTRSISMPTNLACWSVMSGQHFNTDVKVGRSVTSWEPDMKQQNCGSWGAWCVFRGLINWPMLVPMLYHPFVKVMSSDVVSNLELGDSQWSSFLTPLPFPRLNSAPLLSPLLPAFP